MKNLPLGIQEFEKLREENYLYIDKTQSIHNLITSGSYYFLTRPRRFGKSLLLTTIKEIYQGNKELFRDLWIEDKWDWTQQNPVIHIAFNSIGHKDAGLEIALNEEVDWQANQLGLKLSQTGLARRFRELIEKTEEKYGKVVILIDEYDKPIIDYLGKEQLPQAYENQDILKSFYSGLKYLDGRIKSLIITGVSKFSKTGIFSELNNLTDISIDWRFASLLGYTQEELDHYFEPYKDLACQRTRLNRKQLAEKLKEWYNGYTWEGDVYVYNPYSVMSFFQKFRFSNYWFSTGTPTFLIKLLKERFYYNFEGIEVGESAFESHDISNIATDSLLFQTGYLTINEHDEEFNVYSLDYPNKEVKISMLQHLMGAFRHDENTRSTPIVKDLRRAFRSADLEEVIQIVNRLFKTIPSHIFIKKKEAYYHSIVYLVFHYLGQYIDAEAHTADGRIDAVVQTDDHIYIMEFKLDKSADAAIQQIQKKGYAEKYLDTKKKVLAVGINFCSTEKRVEEWKTVEVN